MFALPACRDVDSAEEGACQEEAEACACCQGGRSRRLGLQPRMDGDAGRGLGQGCRQAPWVSPFILLGLFISARLVVKLRSTLGGLPHREPVKGSGHLQMLSLEQRRWRLGCISRAHDVCMGRHNCLQAGVVLWQRHRHSDRPRSQLPDATG